MITATGRVDENGAASLALAHEAKPVELAGEVSRIFLGVQIQCAQCHDHPTDSWKREQFHEFAAFFAGPGPGRSPGHAGQLPVFEVEVQGRPRYTMPDLEDPTKQIPVAPKFFLASRSPSPSCRRRLTQSTRRALAASYITGQDNPWFARAFVNRIWYALMGEAFYDAVDDLGPSGRPRLAEVIETLADQWQKGGYDIRWLFRTILEHDAYQREVRSTASRRGQDAVRLELPQPAPLRPDPRGAHQALGLPADLTAVRPPRAIGGPEGQASGSRPRVEARTRTSRKTARRPSSRRAGIGRWSRPRARRKAIRLGGPRIAFNDLFGVDPSTPNDDVLGTIPQALFLMNSPHGSQPDAGPARNRARPDPDDHARQPGRSERPLPPRSRPASPPPRKSKSAAATSTASAIARGLRGHLLEPDQLDRIHLPALTLGTAMPCRNRDIDSWSRE